MPIQCLRCFRMNPDAFPVCECGHSLPPPNAPPTLLVQLSSMLSKEMRKRDFALGLGLLWILLSIGEWFRIPLELQRKPLWELARDSGVVGVTDLLGALVIGAIAWIGVWVVLAYEEHKTALCPKRITFTATVLSAALSFLSRGVSPGLLLEYATYIMIVIALAIAAYYAGTRGWLGKW